MEITQNTPHTIIGEALRVSTFFATFINDRFDADDLDSGSEDRVAWAQATLDAWENRTERRGAPSREVKEARVILGQMTEADERKFGGEVTIEIASQARAIEDSMIALMVKASRIERIAQAAAQVGDWDREAQANAVLMGYQHEAQAALASLVDIDPNLWTAWLNNDGKSHLDGVTAAIRNQRGGHWTRSRKGNATTIRYDDSAEIRSHTKRHAVGMGDVYELDEDAILAQLEEEAA